MFGGLSCRLGTRGLRQATIMFDPKLWQQQDCRALVRWWYIEVMIDV